MSDRSTFSPFWHRVRAMRPRLRPHVQITRQHYRGRRWYVVHDPSSNQFFRLSAVAHEFVGLLDGTRSVEDVWKISLTRHADEALTQNEVIQLLSQLYSGNLLSADVPPQTEQLLRRGKERFAQRARQQAIGLMYFRIRLFNPDAILAWLEPIFRPLISRVGFILWAVWVLAALAWVIVPNWDRLMSGVDSAVAPSNWGWMFVVFVVLKVIHECGHGLICKRFGGQVPEMGVMLLVLVPAPYVDASSAWTFPDRFRRIAVGAGGMIFELAIAAAAAWVWANTDAGLLHQLAYNAIFTASVSTVLFNANPLMKFDGYYMLSDLLEIPNLMQRAQRMLTFLVQRHFFKMRQALAPTGSPSEAITLIIYGVLALAYRVFLFVSITLYVMGKLFAIGLFLACWTAAMWFILPLGKCIRYLAADPALADRRPRAIAATLVLAALTIVLVGVIPAPDRRRAEGVVESVEKPGIFALTDGFVKTAFVRPGDRVRAGQVLVTLESEQLHAQLVYADALLRETESKALQASGVNQASAVALREYARVIREQIDYLRAKIDALEIRAPRNGVIVGADPAALVGSFVREGQAICEIVDDAEIRIAAVLTQSEAAWLREPPARIETRLVSRVHEVYPARTVRIVEAGTRTLPHEALSFRGGGTIQPAPEGESGRVAKDPVFTGYFIPLDPAGNALGADVAHPGERVALRFTLSSKPLLQQWYLRLRQTLQGRAKV
jgi:putative peptide zinc metalloprotease protein